MKVFSWVTASTIWLKHVAADSWWDGECIQDFDCRFKGQMGNGYPVCGTSSPCCSCEHLDGFNWSAGSCACKGQAGDCNLSSTTALKNTRACVQKCSETDGCRAFDGHWKSNASGPFFMCNLFKEGAEGNGNTTSDMTCYHAAVPDAECTKHVACHSLVGPYCCPTQDGLRLDCCNYRKPEVLGNTLWCIILFSLLLCIFPLLYVAFRTCGPSAEVTVTQRENNGYWSFMNDDPLSWLPTWPYYVLGYEPKSYWVKWLVDCLANQGQEDYEDVAKKAEEAAKEALELRGDGSESLLCCPSVSVSASCGAAIKWLVVGSTILWMFIFCAPWLIKNGSCPESGSYLHTPWWVYVFLPLVILILIVLEAKAITYTLPITFLKCNCSFVIFGGTLKFGKKGASFGYWRAMVLAISVMQQASLCLNSVFVGKALKLERCPRSDLFDDFWDAKQGSSFLGWLVDRFGFHLSFGNEALLCWLFMCTQPIYVLLYVLPWDGLETARVHPDKFQVAIRKDQTMSGALSLLADLSCMYNLNSSDSQIAKGEISEITFGTRPRSTSEMLRWAAKMNLRLRRALERQIIRGHYQVLWIAFAQKAFMCHLQISLMALQYSTLDGSWPLTTFLNIVLNTLLLMVKVVSESKRLILCGANLRKVGKDVRLAVMFGLYLFMVILYVLSLTYIVKKIIGLVLCPSGAATLFGDCVPLEKIIQNKTMYPVEDALA